MGFNGLRVVALESRRANEMAILIRNQGGDAFVAPSMREVPLESNPEVFEFAERLLRGGFDMVIFLTGVGVRALKKILAARFAPERIVEALRGVTLVARGPKPAAALREMGLTPAIVAPEPNTWRELLDAIKGRPEKRIAVQEYGRTNEALLSALRARGAEVMAVRVYLWDLPEDTGPLREAARRVASGEADVLLITTAMQVLHLVSIAAEMQMVEPLLEHLDNYTVIASIGPTSSEALEEFELKPDLTASNPKLGFLVKEAAEKAAELVERKRRR